MRFDQLFIQAIDKVDGYISLFSGLDEQPEKILTEIYTGGSDNLLTRIIESSTELIDDSIEVHDLQDYLYQRLIPYLNTLVKGKTFVFDSESYPSPIHLLDGEQVIGILNIFERVYTVIPHSDIQRESDFLTRLDGDFQRNAQEIMKYEDYQRDLSSYGDTVMKKLQVALRSKHYKKEIKEKYQELLGYSMEIEQNLIAQRLRVERIQEGLRPYKDMQYEIANLFRDKFKYRIEQAE